MPRTIESIYDLQNRIEGITGELASPRVRFSIGARAVIFLRNSQIITDTLANSHLIDLRAELAQLDPEEAVSKRTFAEIRPRFLGHVYADLENGENHNFHDELILAAEAIKRMRRHPSSIYILPSHEPWSNPTFMREAEIQAISAFMDSTIKLLRSD